MGVLERFLNYISIDTQSILESSSFPSSKGQIDFAKLLYQELYSIGFDDVIYENGYIYGVINPTLGYENIDSVGFIAHLDTAPDVSGKNILPQIIDDYKGGDILLKSSGDILSPRNYPRLNNLVGQTLITTDGTTLLGADDKAGIAEIIEATNYIIKNNIPHGKVLVAFTPDEEIGNNIENFNFDYFKPDYAYTIDGDEHNSICFENFNAVNINITFNGVNTHPGDAKDKMINSQMMAMEFHRLLPVDEVPENTEGLEGFYHLHSINGTVSQTNSGYLIRDHDLNKLNERLNNIKFLSKYICNKYGKNTCLVEYSHLYKNMNNYISKNSRFIKLGVSGIKDVGSIPNFVSIRGGTDGADLTELGLPCPNMGSGAMNVHSIYECITKEEMELCSKVIINIINNLATKKEFERIKK